MGGHRARRAGRRARRPRRCRRGHAARRVRRGRDAGRRREAAAGGRRDEPRPRLPAAAQRAALRPRRGHRRAVRRASRWSARCSSTRWSLARCSSAVLAAGAAAGRGREMAAGRRLALPLALLVALVNPLVYQEGDTLLVRGGEFLGRRFDVTLEALAAGGARRAAGGRGRDGVRAVLRRAWTPTSCCALFRRVSYRSALTASLATRLVPVLARDAARMGDAARCRAEPPGRLRWRARRWPGRWTARWTWRRRSRCAATRAAGGRQREPRQPWSRHDMRGGWRGAAGRGRRGRRAGGRRGRGRACTRRSRCRLGPPELALCARR